MPGPPPKPAHLRQRRYKRKTVILQPQTVCFLEKNGKRIPLTLPDIRAFLADPAIDEPENQQLGKLLREFMASHP